MRDVVVKIGNIYRFDFIMLPQKNHLKADRDFKKVFRDGKTSEGDLIKIRFLKNFKKYSRFGFIISNTFESKAVSRNLIKRRLRAAVYFLLKNIKPGFDIIIWPKAALKKSTYQSILNNFKIPNSFYQKWNIENKDNKYLGSMGIYIFKRDVLINLLKKDKREDFGKHLIPTEIKNGKVFSFVYDGYWEDIGTIASFYEANMQLTKTTHALKLNTYDENNPIYTRPYNLPGSRLYNTVINNSLICEGCVLEAKLIENCIIGIRTTIKSGSKIKNSVLLGNSTCKPSKHQNHYLPDKFEIGKNVEIKKAIIDEQVNIGNNVKLINKDKKENFDDKKNGIYVRDGIIIVTAGSKIPDNFVF